MARASDALEAPDIPALEPYQEEGVAFLAGKRYALLGDEMRLGKTPQSILAAAQLQAETVIVVTVAVGIFNWEAQWKRWSPFDQPITVLAAGHKGPIPTGGVIILSFDMARRLGERLPPADLLIVDECHFIKSLDAARTVAVLGKYGLIRRARRAWFLSGTPVPNGDPRELWTILYTCGATPLGFDAFQDRYCVGYQGPYGYQFRSLRNEEELRTLLQQFMLRRLWKDVMSQLPKLTFETVTVPAGPVDLEMWFAEWHITGRMDALKAELARQRLTLEALHDVAEGARRCHSRSQGHVTKSDAFTTGLEHLAAPLASLRRLTALQKVPAVVELITSEFERGVYEKLVIFCQHRDTIEALRQQLAAYKPVTLYGGTNPESRAKHLQKFHEAPHCKVFIGQIQAAGTNIDLSCAADIMFVEQSWTPGDNAQATMRCHNIRQSKPVHVRIISLANDVDARVQESLKRKLLALTKMFEDF